jgi:hypothetical protein
VVDGHVQYVRVTHRVPEVVRREERPCVAPAAYLYRHRLSDETIANDPLHGAKRRVVAVVLADDEKALHPGSNSYEVERVIEAGGQWLLAQHVFPRLQRGPRHNVMRPWRQNHQHRITLDLRERAFQGCILRDCLRVPERTWISVYLGD